MQAALAFGFVGLNIALWLFVLLVQNIQARLRQIPPRVRWGSPSPFLYFQDWHMATWGDWAGLSFIDFVAGYFFLQNLGASELAFALAFGFAASTIFHLRCLHARYRPDAGYPAAGTVSLHGYAHLLYFFVQSTLCGFVLTLLWQDILGNFLWLAIAGTIIYIASFAKDWSEGKLAKS